MTQEDLSARARISVSFLSMIERGERSPHLETLAKIAEALEVRIADFFASADGDPGNTVEPMYRPLLDACRKYNLGKRDVDRNQLAQALEYASWPRRTNLDVLAC